MTLLKLLTILFLTFGINSPVFPSGDVTVAQFTTRIADRSPVNDVKNLSTEYNKIYFYTDIHNCKGCRIEHQWWYNGKMVSSVDGRATSTRYRWWSSKTLNDNMLGRWTVKVFLDGNIIRTKSFTYYEATLEQRQQQAPAPVQKRLQAEEADDCELQLRYFSDKLKEDPNDAYYQFMMKKLGNRCL